MPEGKVLTSNVLQEKFDTPNRKWREYVVAAPGYRVVPSVSAALSGGGGFFFGILAMIAVIEIVPAWVGLALGIGGIPLGVLYAKAMNRFGPNGRLIARGHAARLLGDVKINEAVVEAAKRDAPGYFPLAVRASRLDKLRERIRKLEKSGGSNAELTVRRDELAQGERALRLLTYTDALARGAALLGTSDAAVDAAGSFTAVMYAEIEEGRAQAFDADF